MPTPQSLRKPPAFLPVHEPIGEFTGRVFPSCLLDNPTTIERTGHGLAWFAKHGLGRCEIAALLTGKRRRDFTSEEAEAVIAAALEQYGKPVPRMPRAPARAAAPTMQLRFGLEAPSDSRTLPN